MTFNKEICRNHYLNDTPLENIFIDEYLPDAPGEYVKVYVFAYMYSGINQVMTNELIAKRLGINIEDVLAAWTYWESSGIIRKYYPNPEDETHYDVEFVNIKNAVNRYDNEPGNAPESSKSVKSVLSDESLANLYKEIENITGKMFDPTSALKIAELVDDGVDPSVVSFAYRYCRENNKPTDFKFISAIVRRWQDNKKNSVKEIKEFIEITDNRFAEYRQIMKALGLSYSSITDEERKTFNRWLDEMGYSLAFVLEVCSRAAGMNNKYSYVKKVIENEYEKQNKDHTSMPRKTTLNDRQKYYQQVRQENENKTKEKRAEVYNKISAMKALEEEIRSLSMEIGKILISGKENRDEALRLTKRLIGNKQKEKEELLKKAGFPGDYMEDIYSCYRCKDTGILDDGVHCSCFQISQ